jgi:dTDP-4-dehydrorhamnose reductase
MPGLTDRFFSPLLVNDLADVLYRMLAAGLSGIYHVASPVSLNKYEFGVAISERFGFDPTLVQPTEAAELNYAAPRAGILTLNVEKLTAALGRELPDVHAGIERLHALHAQGYPASLRAMSAAAAPAER